MCSTFAGLFNRRLDIFCHLLTFFVLGIIFGCLTFTFFVIFWHFLPWASSLGAWPWNFWQFCHIFSTFPSTSAGNPVDIRHRHLQTSESTSVQTLNWHHELHKLCSRRILFELINWKNIWVTYHCVLSGQSVAIVMDLSCRRKILLLCGKNCIHNHTYEHICTYIYTYYHMLHVLLLCRKNCIRNHKYADIYVYTRPDYHRLHVNHFLQAATLGKNWARRRQIQT